MPADWKPIMDAAWVAADVRAIDVPPERRGEVLAIVAPRLRG